MNFILNGNTQQLADDLTKYVTQADIFFDLQPSDKLTEEKEKAMLDDAFTALQDVTLALECAKPLNIVLEDFAREFMSFCAYRVEKRRPLCESHVDISSIVNEFIERKVKS